MQTMSETWQSAITASSRQLKGKVEVYNGSTLLYTFLSSDSLAKIIIERNPVKGKFFGYSISQKVTIKVLDKNNNITLAHGNLLKCYIGTESEKANYPVFTISEISRDETGKFVTIVGYDIISQANNHIASELSISFPATLQDYASAIGTVLGVDVVFSNTPQTITYTTTTQPNLDGTETIRSVIDSIAEATGTICYVNSSNKIYFRKLSADSQLIINKSDYMEYKGKQPISLSQITSINELNDATTVGTAGGYNQILRSNPFVVNRTNVSEILTNILFTNTFTPYSMKWRGNPAIEIGDYIGIVISGETINTFYLGETIEYSGGLTAKSSWDTSEQEPIEAKPVNITQAINQTYAKVDKAAQQISLVTSDINNINNNMAQLQLTTNSINSTVTQTQQTNQENFDSINSNISTLTQQVASVMTNEQIQIVISNEISKGTEKIETSTGFTFDESGLNISRSDSEMETAISEDGMEVKKNGTVQLKANNQGVEAVNLNASTYLILGGRSRFENYDTGRIGCFWIGE